ncbi:hypothetical protein V5799_000421 [Amblyomma americanum]|uniref:Uncharacterized protein n=1 Tax=Amblyomma americanum TaxID=6943 RepID=A0AAQ4D337_AMBAM
MLKRPQICLRRSEYTCPQGVPSLLAQVFANSTSLADVTKNNSSYPFLHGERFQGWPPNARRLRQASLYKPNLFMEDPITHFVKAMFSSAHASKSELKTGKAPLMLPVVSNFEFAASYNPEKNSLYVPMGLFGQILQAKREETK